MRIESAEQWEARKADMAEVTVEGDGGGVLVPCLNTLLVRRSLVVANTYNPNHVSDDKMELLRQSIVDNGFAFPVVTIWDEEQQLFVVVDGFHRFLVSGPAWLGMSHVPVVVLKHDARQRMIATWQFNKARGAHEVDLDADLIRALLQQGLDDADVAQHLGIDLDTVYRYKQVAGIADLFLHATWSTAWEMQEASSD